MCVCVCVCVNLGSCVVRGEDVPEIIVGFLDDPLLTAGTEREREGRTQLGCSLELRNTALDQPHNLQLCV